MKFTFKQLFSIVDGRLSTKMDDVYEMLNHITQESLMTHDLPTALRYLREVNPIWYDNLTKQLDIYKAAIGNDFNVLMEFIEANDFEVEIPCLTDQEMTGYNKYMVDNCLLKELGKGVSS